jgi:hypothetical protein
LASGHTASNCGDYVLLTIVTEDEPGVARWLAAAAGGPRAAPVGMRCAAHGTEALH